MILRAVLEALGLALLRDLEQARMDRDHFASERKLLARQRNLTGPIVCEECEKRKVKVYDIYTPGS